jgi:hypothetical protein
MFKRMVMTLDHYHRDFHLYIGVSAGASWTCSAGFFKTKMSMMSQHSNIVRIQKITFCLVKYKYIQPWRTQVLKLPTLLMPILLIGLMYNLKQAW